MMKTSEQIAALQHHLPGAILAVETVRDEISLLVEPRALLEVAAHLRDEAGFVFLENLCGVDYLGREPRFELVIHLLAIASGVRLCLKVGLPEANPVAPSLTALWPTANYQERETYDMFGIIFEGHPSLTRILMPDDWEGHPQRKDVPLGEEEIAFSFNQDRIYAHKPFAKE